MISDADRRASVIALGGRRVTHPAGEFYAIFRHNFTTVAAQGPDFETRSPQLVALSSEVAQLGKQTALEIEGTDGTFRVLRREPDQPSTGFTTLILRG